MVRVKLQGLVVTADGLFVIAQAVEVVAFVGPGSYMTRVKLQGLLVAA